MQITYTLTSTASHSHFLQQLIRRAKIIFHGALIGRLAKVYPKRISDAMQKFDNQQGRRIEPPPRDGGGTRRQIGQSVSQDVKQVDRTASVLERVDVRDFHDGRHRIVQHEAFGDAAPSPRGGGGHSAEVIEALGGAGPENVTDGAGGEGGAEVTFDEGGAGGGEDEEGLDHVIV